MTSHKATEYEKVFELLQGAAFKEKNPVIIMGDFELGFRIAAEKVWRCVFWMQLSFLSGNPSTRKRNGLALIEDLEELQTSHRSQDVFSPRTSSCCECGELFQC